MKKLLGATTLCASLLATSALAEIYVGIDGVVGDAMSYEQEWENAGTTTDVDDDVTGFRAKVGFGSPQGSSFELYYAQLEGDDTGQDIQELGLNFIPYVDITKEFHVFFKVGAGYGMMDIDGTALGTLTGEETWDYAQLQGGIGLSYLFAGQFELIAGYDYKLQAWQDIETATDTLSTTGTGGGAYVGLNIYFGDVGK